jgi:hypothetical protein
MFVFIIIQIGVSRTHVRARHMVHLNPGRKSRYVMISSELAEHIGLLRFLVRGRKHLEPTRSIQNPHDVPLRVSRRRALACGNGRVPLGGKARAT